MAIRATKPATPAAVADAASIASAATIPPPAAADAGDNPRIEPGTMVADRYRVARVLGEGGMGVVYAAEHVLMRKEVALKVLHAEMCSMPEVVARFEREAIAAAHIDHPNVAAATDFGRLPDGSCYLVLELLRGESLRDEIAKGPIPLPRALRILRGIASGVSAAHLKGVVHRDLKPENVMLVERDGEPDFVKVLDFGIAKVDASVEAAPQAGGKVLTRLGAVFGTPEYMAPEQAVGDAVDARADLYALGVVFLEMLTGKCPFSGNALSILRERILAVGPPDMSGVADLGAQALITRLLARQPEDRMQSGVELVAAVDALIGERAGSALPLPPRASAEFTTSAGAAAAASASAVTSPVAITNPSLGDEPPSRTRWIAYGAVALVAASLGAFGVVTVLSRPKAPVVSVRKAPAAATSVLADAPSAAAASLPSPPPATVDSSSADNETPAPTGSAASARATPKTKPSVHRRPQAPPAKKTGPGGIYVPPPKEWFK